MPRHLRTSSGARPGHTGAERRRARVHTAERDRRQAARYAKCVAVSQRIRWDIDRDVIRGGHFDFGRRGRRGLPEDVTVNDSHQLDEAGQPRVQQPSAPVGQRARGTDQGMASNGRTSIGRNPSTSATMPASQTNQITSRAVRQNCRMLTSRTSDAR